MSTFEDVKLVLADVLQLGNRVTVLDRDSGLLGSIPEFDSMAVVSVITAIEENYGFIIDDDEIEAETFETVGSLVDFVETKLNS